MYNVKQTQSEIHELKEKLSIQQQKNQLNELSTEREGELLSNGKVREAPAQEKHCSNGL